MIRWLLALILLTNSLHSKDILLSFDGSADLTMWEDTLNYAKENNVKFTYFISAPYFVSETDELASEYWAPKELGEPSPIQFRKTETSWAIKKRFDYLRRAQLEGHEIGSHLVGHYNGKRWTKEQWQKELAFFDKVFRLVPDILSIRTPCLGINQAYFDTLNESNYLYDSSTVGGRFKHHYNLGKIKTLEFPEIRIINKPTSGYTLPMDYNFHTLGVSPELVKQIFLNTIKNYYENTEGPIMICLHFEEMDKGVYHEALKELVDWLKDKNPRYLTYTEYLKGVK